MPRTVYLDDTTGSASPTDPTSSNDPYNSWANLRTNEIAPSSGDSLTVECSGYDLGAFDDGGLFCTELTVNMEANSPTYSNSWCRFTNVDLPTVIADASFPTVINGIVVEITRTTSADNQAIFTDTTSKTFNGGFVLASGESTGETRGATGNNGVYNNVIFANIGDVSSSTANYGLRGLYQANNCIVYNCGNGAQLNNASSRIINSVMGGNAGPYGDLRDASGTVDYNATEDADARGANGVAVTNVSSLFTNVTSLDFSRVTPASDALFEAGVTDAGSGSYSDDITGTTRAGTWDIGPEEYAVAVNLGASLELRDGAGSLVSSSTGITTAIWAQGTALSSAPDYFTNSASTNGSGILEIDSDSVGSAADEVGFIVAYELGADLNSDQFLARRFKVIDITSSTNRSDTA